MKPSTIVFCFAVLAYLISIAHPAPAADEIGYVETFALAEDRAEALEQLIPGTEAYYFYHALHYQNTGKAEKLRDILGKWRKRVESSELRDLIERRERLLAYDRDPKASLEWLRNELGIHFAHQREREPGQTPDLPTTLDPGLVSREAFIKRATANRDNLGGFQDSAVDWDSTRGRR